MLIACFQCRQQLDVPSDSAGKRVRCPHCQYVIVVPAQQSAGEAATALPSMELDAGAEQGSPTVKIAPLPLPLPPFEMPPVEKVPPQPLGNPADELPPVPSIDRHRHRHRPATTDGTGVRWGRLLAIGAVVALVLVCLITGVFSSHTERRRVRFGMNNVQPPEFDLVAPPRMQIIPPAVPKEQWRWFAAPKQGFKAQFPAVPKEFERRMNQAKRTEFHANNREWEYSISHEAMEEHEFKRIAIAQRFQMIELEHLNEHHARVQGRANLQFAGVHPGQFWEMRVFNVPEVVFIRAYFIRDGDFWHHFVLTVRAPHDVRPEHADVARFFDSFTLMFGESSGRAIIEEFDALNQGGLRINEFTALALHPKVPVAIAGSAWTGLRAVMTGPNLNELGEPGAIQNPLNDQFERKILAEKLRFTLAEGMRVEQLAISPSGRWIASSAVGIVQWRDWNDDRAQRKPQVDARRCAFTKDDHLVVATKNEIRKLDPATGVAAATLAIPDLDIKGFALCPEDAMLAVFGDKAIEFWDWRQKKKLGRVPAHDGDVTAVVFAPDGKTLASAGADGAVKLWNVETRATWATLRQHAWSVCTLAFTPDGKRLASGGLDGMLLLWDLEPDGPRVVWAQAHQFPVRAIAFDADGKSCYFTCKHAARQDGQPWGHYFRQVRKVLVGDMKPNPQEAERVIARNAGLHLPATSVMTYLTPDGKTCISTTDNADGFNKSNSLRVWDLATGTLRHAHSMQGNGWLSPDGRWFVFDWQNRLRLLEVAANRVSVHTPLNGAGLQMAMFAADGKSIWVQRNLDFVRLEIEDPPGGARAVVQKNKVPLRNPGEVGMSFVRPASDHKTFLVETRSPDGVMRSLARYSASDGKLLPAPKSAGAWSRHLSLRMVAGWQVELHDRWSGISQVVGQQRQPLLVNGVANTPIYAVHPERKLGVTTAPGNDQTIILNLWDLETRRPLLTLPETRSQSLQSVSFSADGRYLSLVTSTGWTRIVPTDWLLDRKGLLPCQPNEVAAP